MSDGRRKDSPVWAGFDWSAERYEGFIRKIVPDYGRQERLIADLVREAQARGNEARAAGPAKGSAGDFRILDLGAGTGTLACALLEAFPGASLTAVDVSPAMLAACGAALGRFGPRARVVEGDFRSCALGSDFGAVVSRLAIHHLDDAGKAGLYRRVFAALRAGGVFVSCDLVAPATQAEREERTDEWRRHIAGLGEDPADWEQGLVGADDYPATLPQHFDWLAQAGFVAVRVPWARGGFALVSGVKPASAAGPPEGQR